MNFQIKIGHLDNPSLHSIPVCAEHYAAVEHLMVCAICKRRLARNHIHYLGSECEMLNTALQKEGIPVTLNDKPVVCKLCRYFASLLLKPPPLESQSNTAEFFRQYKKRFVLRKIIIQMQMSNLKSFVVFSTYFIMVFIKLTIYYINFYQNPASFSFNKASS